VPEFRVFAGDYAEAFVSIAPHRGRLRPEDVKSSIPVERTNWEYHFTDAWRPSQVFHTRARLSIFRGLQVPDVQDRMRLWRPWVRCTNVANDEYAPGRRNCYARFVKWLAVTDSSGEDGRRCP
jgi:hypothetical protein